MADFAQILEGIMNFFNTHLISLLWILFAFYIGFIMKKSKPGTQWLQKQLEWLKAFFDDDANTETVDGRNPSHKNLIGLSVVAVFCIAFLKKVVSAVDVPDIPAGWQIVILGILGIRAVQGAIEKVADKKYSAEITRNGNGNGHIEPEQEPEQKPDPSQPPSGI